MRLKILSILLAVCVSLSLMPAAAVFADENDNMSAVQEYASEESINAGNTEGGIPSEVTAPEAEQGAGAVFDEEVVPAEEGVEPSEAEEAEPSKEQTLEISSEKALKNKAITLSSAKNEESKTALSVTNNTGMFKVTSAYLIAKAGKTELVITLSGSGYHELYKGTYEQAVANGDNRANWIHGSDASGEWEFTIPVGEGETYIPCVAISNSYVERYERGINSLERAFYPRQLVLDPSAKTLVTGDYDNAQELSVINNVKMFKPQTAILETVGGPNSNSYRSELALTMGSDAFDKVCYGTKEQAADSQNIYNIDDRTFNIPVRWVEVFGRPETMVTVIGSPVTLSFHSVNTGEWYERVMTIDENNGSVVFDPVKEDTPDGDDPSPAPQPPAPTPAPTPGGDDGGSEGGGGYQPNTGGSTAAVDNSTALADGIYQPDKFSFSGGSGRIVISCRQVEVRGQKAYATIVFQNIRSGSTEMSYVKAAGGIYYCSQEGGASVVTIPVELNRNNTVIGLTTKMSAAHEITYTIFVYIAGADAQKGGALTSNSRLDTEAPVIAGLEYAGEEKIENAEFFKIFNYQDGIRLLEIDMRVDPKNTEGNEDAGKEEKKEQDSEKDKSKKTAVIEEEEGQETEAAASKADAQAELYKGNVVKYLIVPENIEIPAGLDKETIVVQLPVKSVYSGSEDITGVFEKLGKKDLITSKPKKDKKEKDNKKIQEAGDHKNLDLKKLVKSKCALAMLPEECVKDKDAKKKFVKLAEDLANLDIPVIVDRSELEEKDTAKAEWLIVYGIILGCENEAKQAYQDAVNEAGK